ncbi:MAG: DNA cytosine methyltransferase [Pseudomonadota bacterium]|nr:DNA cytosine methyltransferase [Pseudomonadota bacterium]MDP1904909.1 DNA cytosine methyltransferase [Pseudomonadota bacterium]MDP2352032.1 DNA cytosine methyltransferase [Pseudomonadota bacterium]
MKSVEIKHFHLFAGLGGGAAGFNRGEARVGSLQAQFRCLGGIDVNAAAIRDFGRLAGVPGTVMDLFDREQYVAFHGHEPPAGWREATLDDIRRAAGNERPHIVFTSPPCKGLSGLLSENKSRSDKYQALNRLTLRGIWLTMEAWADDPPEFVILENVPRIQSRGRHLLDQIGDVLRSYGYAVAETTHDCGELGGLAQSRKRFLLVARHTGKISPFLYEPHKRPLHAVGDVLGRMPLPGDPAGGPMHRVPRLQWKTWVRLAFVEAGSDWRSLNRLNIVDGHLADYLIVPERRRDYLGVTAWDEPGATVSARGLPTNGRYSVADPRFHWREYGQYGVLPWDVPTGAISGQSKSGGGGYTVADPRPTGPIFGKYAVTQWHENSGTVISTSTAQGAYSVADPRPGLHREQGDHYLTAGHYGVVPWASPSGAVTASSGHDNGYGSVADPRMDVLPAATDNLVAVIRALDGTWHRPFTTLELAALQGLVDPEEQLELDGLSDSGWRERIGNAVPPPAAQAIASMMGQTLLLAWSGETFSLGNTPIWVRPVAVALAVRENRNG